MTTQIIGRVMMAFKGNYDATKQYDFLDTVTYNGSSYVCLVNGTTTAPSDSSSNWQLMAKAGNTPDTSQFALKSELPDLTSYAKLSDIPSLDGYAKKTDLSGYYTKAETDTKLSTKADQAEYQTLNDKVNNMQIGGRNLLTNTDKDISVTSHTTDGWPAWASIDTGFSFEHGKTYTFSTEAKNSTSKIAEASIRVFEYSTNTQVGIYAFPADGKRHSITFSIPNDSHNYHLLLFAGHAGIVPGVNVTTAYHHPKLEEGNVSTDWTPAPEDFDTKLDAKADKSELVDYAKKSEIPASADLSLYAKKSDLPSLTGYAKLTDIPNLTGYLKQTDLADYAKSADVPKITKTVWSDAGITYINGAKGHTDNDKLNCRAISIGDVHIVQVKGWFTAGSLGNHNYLPQVQVPAFGFENDDYYFEAKGSVTSFDSFIQVDSLAKCQINLYSYSTQNGPSIPLNAMWIY